jgi:hypothetical protein
MRVIVVKPYKSYNVGVELDVNADLIRNNPGTFKPIVTVRATTAPHVETSHTDHTDEEE